MAKKKKVLIPLFFFKRFVVWETRHGTFKIKSVLKGTETEGECFHPPAFYSLYSKCICYV